VKYVWRHIRGITGCLGFLAVVFSGYPVRGANVTLTDNGTSVTIANGIVSILCTKSGATIDQVNYTYDNGGGTQTVNLLSGGNNGGQLYWELGGFGGGTFSYSLIADPANNGGDYAEISLVSSSGSSGTMEVRFSMRRGSSGFYVTPIWSHRSIDGFLSMGETRDNIYAGTLFNWMSVDASRNRLMSVSPSAVAIGVLGAPQEVSLWTNGIYAGRYEDKYKYSADFGDQRVWGWSSVGTGGKNVGLWNVSATAEYYNGGPLKRELMSHIGTTILNMTHGGHYGGGADSFWGAGEDWTHVYGPYFIYCNNISSAITQTNQAAQALYQDALAQATTEASAWPYTWFTNVANYAPPANRGTVAGQIVISDTFNPNASASNLWVGLIRQPVTITNNYDFQMWTKPYQFWVRTDGNGNFIIPNVIATNNYTLYAFGPGAAGTFQSQAQTGGSTPNSIDIPASPFSVTVTGGATNSLGTVTWTPARVGPTVFEIGYPDRTARKFRHGEDWWVGDLGPNPANPSPVWSKWLEYPFDFPAGPSYTVGQSRWTTDWNFCQPVVTDSAGNYNPSTSTINFNLDSAPGGTASLYIATASDYQGPLIIQVNGNNIAGVNGYDPAYDGSGNESDSTIREGIHGLYSDHRITFTGLLAQGPNTITINMRKGGYFANHAMYDYIRLEMPGYVPSAPASVVAYPGNGSNLVCWPVMPGATGYNILRTTNSGSNYVAITSGVVGPVCGSGWNNATYLDTNAVNGTTYYYVVQSTNTVGTSTNSPESGGAMPSGSLATSAPDAPAGLVVGSVGHQSVGLNWTASAGANFYTVYRSTLFDNGGGASNVLGTIVLANNVTSATYTDTSPTDGSTYSYYVTATSAGGTSGNSTAAVAVPLPSAPASAPGALTANFTDSDTVVLNWSPVSGAVGYIIRRATSPGGPFTFLMSVTETTYTDNGLDISTTYYYQVSAVNAAAVSANSSQSVTAPPYAPASLSAIPGNSQVTLNWTPVANAAKGYYLYRGTSSGNENVTVLSAYAGTSYTNTGLANGTTYYYFVAASNSVGLGPDSPEASATPGTVFTSRNLTWKGDGGANIWDAGGAFNWKSNTTVTIFNNGDIVTFDNNGSNNVAVAVPGSVQPSLVTYNASKNYTFSGLGGITGTNMLIKTGTGTWTISTTNTCSGGLVLSNGTTVTGSIGANRSGLGTGPITFAGGTLQFNGWNGSDGTDYGGNTNALVIPANQTGTIHLPVRFLSPGLSGTLSGSGTMNLVVQYVRGDISGNWSAFTGLINVLNGTGGDDFRPTNINGWPNARLNIGPNINMYSRSAPNAVIPIGEFSAASSVSVGADGAGGAGGKNLVTWRVGGLNTDATNAASFQGVVQLIKEGTGTWTLTGASTQTGTTVVSNGLLLVNGTFNGSPVTVKGGQLGGTGVLAGAGVNVNVNGGFAPGPLAGFGTLTVSNNLTLAAGSTTFIQLQHSPLTNDAAKISGTLSENGTLVVTNIGVAELAAGDSFKLFSAGTYGGSFASLSLPPLASGLAWNSGNLNVDGTLGVMTIPPPVLNMLSQLTNGAFRLNFTGLSGVGYEIRASTNLVQAPWTNWDLISTGLFNGGPMFFDDLSATNFPQRFYRIRIP